MQSIRVIRNSKPSPVMLTMTQEARPRPKPRTYEFKESRPRPSTFLIKDKGKATTKLESNQETYATMAQFLSKQAQSQPKLKSWKVNSCRTTLTWDSNLAVRLVYKFKDKLTRPTQGQWLNHKAKTKANRTSPSRPRTRTLNNITGLHI